MKDRFTIQPGRWYACEIIGDEFDEDCCSYSPIRVDRIEPLKSGNQIFKLYFYHANYPEGVRDKQYTLRTIERQHKFIFAKSIDHEPARILQIYDLDIGWLDRHFPNINVHDDDIQRWLTDNA